MKAVTKRSDDFIPPHSLEAEMAMLGSMMLSERACGELSWVRREMIYQPAHRMVFDALRWLYDEGRQIDLVTVKDFLIGHYLLQDAGGTEYLIQIMESVPSAKNASHYADIVRDKWVLRELQAGHEKCLSEIDDPDQTPAQKIEAAMSITQGLLDATTYEFNAGDVARNLHDSTKPGAPTGISAIDEHSDVGGLYPDEPNVIAALTGVGKTVIGLNLVKRWCRNGDRVLFVSLELKAEKLVRRLIKMLCGFGDRERAIRFGAEADYDAAVTEIAGWDLTIYDPSKTRGGTKDVESICEWVVAKHERKPVDRVVMDYAQFFKSREKSDGKTRLMETVEENLRSLNTRCGFVMVVLAQLIMERDKNGKQYFAIRNSREFGLGAAYVLHILHEKKEGSERYWMTCEKNRSGKGRWEHDLYFDHENLTFSSHPSTSMR